MSQSVNKNARILIIRSGAIGDTLMITPLLRAIRASHSNAYIAVVTSANAADILRFNPNVNEVLPIKYRHLPHWASLEKRRLIRRFANNVFDFIISLESHSDFTALAQQMRCVRIITFDRTAGSSNIEHIVPRTDEHSVEVNLRAGEAIGITPNGLQLECFYPDTLDDRISAQLQERGISDEDTLIGIHAGWGARRQHPENTRLRSWPAKRFVEIVKWLVAEHNAKIVFTGSRYDRALNEIIGLDAAVPYLNTAGKYSILETAALIRRMSLFLSVDSGPAHIAAALGTPLVNLWGPGIYSATSPVQGSGPIRIIRSPPPCAPCYGTDAMHMCTDNICMKQITVEDVQHAIAELLDTRR